MIFWKQINFRFLSSTYPYSKSKQIYWILIHVYDNCFRLCIWGNISVHLSKRVTDIIIGSLLMSVVISLLTLYLTRVSSLLRKKTNWRQSWISISMYMWWYNTFVHSKEQLTFCSFSTVLFQLIIDMPKVRFLYIVTHIATLSCNLAELIPPPFLHSCRTYR